ncbi:hypothetical protein GGX14DRAFT_409141 [Mycena pura]|uniref:Uncharacterized protein n=1 Tax=Mycena pura TaxID=153505 RepID=A0AAD6XVB6_9AGAR|nr:hypothetical protein GGX14DRAFT_409141 [Mycena pura]
MAWLTGTPVTSIYDKMLDGTCPFTIVTRGACPECNGKLLGESCFSLVGDTFPDLDVRSPFSDVRALTEPWYLPAFLRCSLLAARAGAHRATNSTIGTSGFRYPLLAARFLPPAGYRSTLAASLPHARHPLHEASPALHSRRPFTTPAARCKPMLPCTLEAPAHNLQYNYSLRAPAPLYIVRAVFRDEERAEMLQMCQLASQSSATVLERKRSRATAPGVEGQRNMWRRARPASHRSNRERGRQDQVYSKGRAGVRTTR